MTWTGHRCRRSLAASSITLVLAVAGCGGTADSPSATATSGPPGTTSPPAETTTTLPGARPSPGCEPAGRTGTTQPLAAPTEHNITVDGADRTYVLSTAGTQPDAPAPVVVLLHGMGSTAADINQVSDLANRAADTGTIVVTPQAVGTPTIWRPAAQGPDPAFLDQILEDLGRTHCIDTARIHLAGFSVGAALATAYACARQDQVASIVTVTVEAPAGCTEPMPILSFHGTADPIIAYGNPDPAAPGGITGTEANMASWAATGGCQPAPTVTELGTEAARLEWPDCTEGAEVVLYRITGGGHDWPGKDPATVAGPGTREIDLISATDEALAFFSRHSG